MNAMPTPPKPGEAGIRLTEEQLRRRKQRNWAIAGTLAVLIVLFYVLTIVKLSGAGGH